MSECSGHTCLPHLEKRDRHFWSFFRSREVQRGLLLNKAPFPARVTFLFPVAKIGATDCASSVIPQNSFPRLTKNVLFLPHADVAICMIYSLPNNKRIDCTDINRILE